MTFRLFGAKPLIEQWLFMVDCTFRNKTWWNFDRNSTIFSHENTFEMSTAKLRSLRLGLNIQRIMHKAFSYQLYDFTHMPYNDTLLWINDKIAKWQWRNN